MYLLYTYFLTSIHKIILFSNIRVSEIQSELLCLLCTNFPLDCLHPYFLQIIKLSDTIIKISLFYGETDYCYEYFVRNCILDKTTIFLGMPYGNIFISFAMLIIQLSQQNIFILSQKCNKYSIQCTDVRLRAFFTNQVLVPSSLFLYFIFCYLCITFLLSYIFQNFCLSYLLEHCDMPTSVFIIVHVATDISPSTQLSQNIKKTTFSLFLIK